MTAAADIDETDLHAFVDGELDAAARARIERWLRDHPDDAARVQDWARQKTLLHAAFDAVLDEPAPPGLAAAMAGRRPARAGALRLWLGSAAAVVLFALGVGSGWVLHERIGQADADALLGQAVSAHVVFVREKRHAVEVWAKEQTHLVKWLSRRLDHTLRAADLTGAGFRLVGGRLIADRGMPAAQLMYEDSAGRRLTLYVRRSARGGDTSFRFAARDGLSAFTWIGEPLAFALVGKLERGKLLRLARLINAQEETLH